MNGARSPNNRLAAYSLADFSFIVLDENAVLLTYNKATQDAVCGGSGLKPCTCRHLEQST